MKKYLQIGFLLGWFALEGHAQYHTDAAGGVASGSGGTVSFSVGQIDYGTRTGPTGILTEGVQQPFEINLFTGIQTLRTDIQVDVFPNPASTSVTIHASDVIPETLYCTLMDITGRVVVEERMSGSDAQLDVAELPNGIYYLSVRTSNQGIRTFKLIVNK